MKDGNTAMLDIYVQQELGEKFRTLLPDAEQGGLSALLRSLLDELQSVSEDDDANRR